MTILQSFLGAKTAPIPLTPYSIATINTGSAVIGSGSTGSGTAASNGAVGTMYIASSMYISTTAGTSAGHYTWLSPSNSGAGASLYSPKNAVGSTPYPGTSLAYGKQSANSNDRPRFQYSGQATYYNIFFNISGNLPDTVGTGTFVNTTITTPYSMTLTETAGGSLIIVSVSANSTTGITVSGGEGTGSASTSGTVGTLTNLGATWQFLGQRTTGSSIMGIFCYYRTAGTVTPQPIIVTSAGNTSTDVAIGVAYITTPSYDTNPVPPVLNDADTGWVPLSWGYSIGAAPSNYTNTTIGLASADDVFSDLVTVSGSESQNYFYNSGIKSTLTTAGATVLRGVEIRMTGKRTGDDPTIDTLALAIDNGGSASQYGGLTPSTSSINTAIIYGSPTDNWGASMASMLASTSVGIYQYNWGGFSIGTTWSWDYLEMRVYYSYP